MVKVPGPPENQPPPYAFESTPASTAALPPLPRAACGRWSGCWRGATRLLAPAAVAPPGDRQSPTST
eukprot:3633890-Prymnesium_polylepis.1